MSLFGNILEKLGLKHPAAQEAPAKPVVTVSPPAPQITPTPPPAQQVIPANPFAQQVIPATPSAPQVPPVTPSTPQFLSGTYSVSPAVPATPATPAAIPLVDVVSKLEHLAATSPVKLDWKVSIVDLLKLLDLDSSFEARKELAIELGCPADKMDDSAQMNTWLHKTVLQKLAENGGNIPKELLD